MKRKKADQARRFQEAAKELGADPEAFERAFGKIVPPKKRPRPN